MRRYIQQCNYFILFIQFVYLVSNINIVGTKRLRGLKSVCVSHELSHEYGTRICAWHTIESTARRLQCIIGNEISSVDAVKKIITFLNNTENLMKIWLKILIILKRIETKRKKRVSLSK
jgi:hypothetical protein